MCKMPVSDVSLSQHGWGVYKVTILPRKLTWNLKITPLNRIFILQTSILGLQLSVFGGGGGQVHLEIFSIPLPEKIGKYCSKKKTISRWWFQFLKKAFTLIWGFMIQFDGSHIFETGMGWSKHHLKTWRFCAD